MTKRIGGLGHRSMLRPGVTSVVIAVGFSVFGLTTAAGAAAAITVTPDTSLTNGQSVSVAGTGLAANSLGSVIQCNIEPNEPTVALGPPLSRSIPVGCTAISVSALVTTSASGTVAATFHVVTGTPGPPCGPSPAAATCPATDSAGQSPTTDAANFPCPPTAAQLAAGVPGCVVVMADQGGDKAYEPIFFQGETVVTTTVPGAAPATTAPVGTAHTSSPAATVAPAPSTGASTGTSTGAGAAASDAPATAVAAATPGAMAKTGPGVGLWFVAVAGGGLVSLGLAGLVLGEGPRRARKRSLRPGADRLLPVTTTAPGTGVAAPTWPPPPPPPPASRTRRQR